MDMWRISYRRERITRKRTWVRIPEKIMQLWPIAISVLMRPFPQPNVNLLYDIYTCLDPVRSGFANVDNIHAMFEQNGVLDEDERVCVYILETEEMYDGAGNSFRKTN